MFLHRGTCIVCVWLYMCAGTCRAWLEACLWRPKHDVRSQPGPLFHVTVVSLGLVKPRAPLGLVCSQLALRIPRLRLPGLDRRPAVWDQNSGLPACEAKALPTEPHSRPCGYLKLQGRLRVAGSQVSSSPFFKKVFFLAQLLLRNYLTGQTSP